MIALGDMALPAAAAVLYERAKGIMGRSKTSSSRSTTPF
jgi:hypothetical protein